MQARTLPSEPVSKCCFSWAVLRASWSPIWPHFNILLSTVLHGRRRDGTQINLIGIIRHYKHKINLNVLNHSASNSGIGPCQDCFHVSWGVSRRMSSPLWNSRATRRRKRSSPGCTNNTRNISSWSSTCRKRNSGNAAFMRQSFQMLPSASQNCNYWTFSPFFNDSVCLELVFVT